MFTFVCSSCGSQVSRVWRRRSHSDIAPSLCSLCSPEAAAPKALKPVAAPEAEPRVEAAAVRSALLSAERRRLRSSALSTPERVAAAVTESGGGYALTIEAAVPERTAAIVVRPSMRSRGSQVGIGSQAVAAPRPAAALPFPTLAAKPERRLRQKKYRPYVGAEKGNRYSIDPSALAVRGVNYSAILSGGELKSTYVVEAPKVVGKAAEPEAAAAAPLFYCVQGYCLLRPALSYGGGVSLRSDKRFEVEVWNEFYQAPTTREVMAASGLLSAQAKKQLAEAAAALLVASTSGYGKRYEKRRR